MSEKIKSFEELGDLDLASKPFTPENIDFDDIPDSDWGYSIDSNVVEKLNWANYVREEAFAALEAAKKDEPRVPEMIEQLKALRADLKEAEKDVSSQTAEAWAIFNRSQPARVILARDHKDIAEKNKNIVNERINRTEAVIKRNNLLKEISELQAEVDAIGALRPMAWERFKEAEETARSVGLDPETIWPRKKEKVEVE